MSQDLAQIINDGLCYYEDHQFDDDDFEQDCAWISTSQKQKHVNLISQAEFDKLKPSEGKKTINPSYAPPPPPLNTPAASKMQDLEGTPSKNKSKNQPHFYPVTKVLILS